MIDVLAGLVKPICDIAALLTTTWAAKLDALADTRLTSARATKLDSIDAAVSSRLGSIKSVQRGTISVSMAAGGVVAATATATITSVNTARTSIQMLGLSLDVGGVGAVFGGRLALTSATTLTGYIWRYNNASNDTFSIGYQVIEYNA